MHVADCPQDGVKEERCTRSLGPGVHGQRWGSNWLAGWYVLRDLWEGSVGKGLSVKPGGLRPTWWRKQTPTDFLVPLNDNVWCGVYRINVKLKIKTLKSIFFTIKWNVNPERSWCTWGKEIGEKPVQVLPTGSFISLSWWVGREPCSVRWDLNEPHLEAVTCEVRTLCTNHWSV